MDYILNFKPIQKQNCDCYDMMLWNYAAQLNLDITLSFIDTFNFEYGVLSEKAMSSTMVLRAEHSSPQVLSRYCGLQIISEASQLSEETIERYIRRQNKAIGVQMDSFFLPWNPYYRQAHRKHYLLVIGFNSNSYICSDVFFSTAFVLISKKDILENAVNYIFFEQVTIQPLKMENILKDLKSSLTEKHEKNLLRFKQDVKKLPNDDSSDDVHNSSLIFSLAIVKWNRKNYALALNKAQDLLASSLL